MSEKVNLYSPLPPKEVEAAEYVKKLLSLDPYPIYERLGMKLNIHSRYNYLSFNDMFPKGTIEQLGCSSLVENQKLAIAIWEVIAGIPDKIKWYLRYYYGHSNCAKCGNPGYDLDHIVPLAEGGGGCWLSNYQLLCTDCHAIKTAQENGWEKSKWLKNDKN